MWRAAIEMSNCTAWSKMLPLPHIALQKPTTAESIATAPTASKAQEHPLPRAIAHTRTRRTAPQTGHHALIGGTQRTRPNSRTLSPPSTQKRSTEACKTTGLTVFSVAASGAGAADFV